MSAGRAPGRFLTFYSYKGGTGRSMVIANVAWLLASSGARVLLVDWDLEAPGLHRYLHPFLIDPELAASDGVIDFVGRFSDHALRPGREPARRDAARLAALERYAINVEWDFPNDGTLHFVPAGRQDQGYATRVNSFDWQGFYERLGGGAFLQEVRARLRGQYDYVLVDSRTGVSDTAGICTVELPDVLVLCFTLNAQSIEGVAAVAASVPGLRPGDDLELYPVPMRVEFAEKERLDRASDYARHRLDRYLPITKAAWLDEYWNAVQVLYHPYYAYEEVLAVFGDRPHQGTSVLGALQRLTGYLTGGAVVELPPIEERLRRQFVERFSMRLREEPAVAEPEQPASAVPGQDAPYVYLSHSHRAGEFGRRLADALTRTGRLSVVEADREISPGEQWDERLEQLIRGCAALVAVVSRDATRAASFVRQEWAVAREYGRPIFPVVLHRDARLPEDLADLQALDFSFAEAGDPQEQRFRTTVQRLVGALRSALDRAGEARPPVPQVTELRIRITAENRVVATAADIQVDDPLRLEEVDRRVVELLRALVGRDLQREGEIRVLGSVLYRAVFGGRVGDLLGQLLAETSLESGTLRLVFELPLGDPFLADLPWEFCYGALTGTEESFLAVSTGLTLVRQLPSATPGRLVAPDHTALNILVSAGSPEDEAARALAGLAAESVGVQVEVTTSRSLDVVLRQLARIQPHVLHLANVRVWSNTPRKELVLFDASGRPIDSKALALLPEAHPELRLLVLQIADAHPASVPLADWARSLGAGAGSTDLLLLGAAPAPTLERFCVALYTALRDGKVLDEAVQAARRTLYWTPEEWIGQGSFGPPIMYMRNSNPIVAPHVRRPSGGW